jgi:hypothetical protein
VVSGIVTRAATKEYRENLDKTFKEPKGTVVASNDAPRLKMSDGCWHVTYADGREETFETFTDAMKAAGY